MIVRIINPASGDAVEILQAIFGMCPKAALQSIGRSTAIAPLANVGTFRIIKTENRVLPSMSSLLVSDVGDTVPGCLGIENENVASLLFLIVNQRKHIHGAELRKCLVRPDPRNVILMLDRSSNRFEHWKHLKVFIRG